MSFEQRVWIARDVQYKNRYLIIPTGVNVNEYTATRSEGNIIAAGDIVSAENMNNLEARIKSAIDEAGSQFTVLGHYDTLSALQTAHSTGNAGDAYFVGTSTPYNVYLWDTVSSAWINVGEIAGPIGPAGADGADGTAATIAVGTVTTGAAGSSAAVANSGTTSAAVFDFTIPQGNKGDKGDTGETGPQGPAGADGTSFTVLGLYATLSDLQTAHPTGSAGNAYAVGTAESNTIYNWDIDTSAWVNIGNLQGPAGVAGTAATITVGTVTTGAAGSDATVTNSGTTSAAVFNFSIPQGIQGIQGIQGETGATGESGIYPELTTGTELQPNTKYDFGEVTSLTLTLATPTSSESNEYLFCFKSGTTATTLSLPAGVKWVNGSAPTIKTNKSYIVSILYANSEYLVAAGEF